MWLALETALTACSVALFDAGDRLVAHRHELIGRGHAERLVPLVAELLAEAGQPRVQAIAVDVGPGSFTGLRVGIAAARAFGLAWQASVNGCSSTALTAAGAFAAYPDVDRLSVMLDAARGELWFQSFARDGLTALNEVEALAPGEAARRAAPYGAVVGSGAELAIAVAEHGLRRLDHDWPDARSAALLPHAARAWPPKPLYVRAPDARLPAATERRR